jgi:hypothetical protein
MTTENSSNAESEITSILEYLESQSTPALVEQLENSRRHEKNLQNLIESQEQNLVAQQHILNSMKSQLSTLRQQATNTLLVLFNRGDESFKSFSMK